MDSGSYENLSDALIYHGDSGKPSPDNFYVFLPWACRQLRLEFDVVITNIIGKQLKASSNIANKAMGRLNKGKRHAKPESNECDTACNTSAISNTRSESLESSGKNVKLTAIYDNSGNIIQLKFEDNKAIPRLVFQIITLILQYHKYLESITINKGISNVGIYELNNMLAVSNITDICLDNTAINNGNYDTLLDNTKYLRHLSLARCKITDKMVKKIAAKIAFPLFSSQTLSLLNLTSNEITDTGAKYFAGALRSNRQLVYLNLSDNSITDVGAIAILDILFEFILTEEEILSSKTRQLCYLKEKKKLIADIIEELQNRDLNENKDKRKPKTHDKATLVKGTVLDTDHYTKNIDDAMRQLKVEAIIDEANIIAERKMGEFTDPFCSECVSNKGNLLYCNGNNRLAYLNLSYNNISYLSIKRLLAVLSYQKLMDRKPRGLVNVSIEGNPIPVSCIELTKIDAILTSHMALSTRKFSVARKKV